MSCRPPADFRAQIYSSKPLYEVQNRCGQLERNPPAPPAAPPRIQLKREIFRGDETRLRASNQPWKHAILIPSPSWHPPVLQDAISPTPDHGKNLPTYLVSWVSLPVA